MAPKLLMFVKASLSAMAEAARRLRVMNEVRMMTEGVECWLWLYSSLTCIRILKMMARDDANVKG